jgi:hypothetical protein
MKSVLAVLSAYRQYLWRHPFIHYAAGFCFWLAAFFLVDRLKVFPPAWSIPQTIFMAVIFTLVFCGARRRSMKREFKI